VCVAQNQMHYLINGVLWLLVFNVSIFLWRWFSFIARSILLLSDESLKFYFDWAREAIRWWWWKFLSCFHHCSVWHVLLIIYRYLDNIIYVMNNWSTADILDFCSEAVWLISCCHKLMKEIFRESYELKSLDYTNIFLDIHLIRFVIFISNWFQDTTVKMTVFKINVYFDCN
jgi:hypothetical protein